EIYFGSGTWGLEMAARTYFGKSARDLTLSECAALAGIPRNPEYYSPLNNLDATTSRRNLVLSRMQQFGYITAEQGKQAQGAPLRITNRETVQKRVASYFLSAVVGHIVSRYENGLELAYRGGWKVYTGLDLNMQKAAESALSKLPKFSTDDQGVTQPQTALVALDPQTGQIRAYVGGRDFAETQFDRAVNAKRQPGSAFKPFLYSAAIDSKRYTAASLFWCTPDGATFPQGGNLPPYKPTDFGNPYHWRQMTLREALAQSDNVISVKLNSEVGPEVTARYATNMGITSPLTANLPLALGASDVTPLEITAAYCTLANGGYRVQPILITKIVDTNGRVLEENQGKREKALDEKTAYVLTSMLKSVIEPGGTASAGAIGRPAAGKTGTSDEYRDAWFIGYTPQLVAGIYVGDDQKKPLQQTGGALTSPIWAAFMKQALVNVPASDFKMPAGIKTVRVDPTTGYVATAYCPNPRDEIFIAGTEPRQACPVHKAPPAPKLPIPNLPNIWDWIPRFFNGR
ncbi:MAG: penicillin-binding transpeptidase domain-containing protein, partial [Bacillota bacterium]